MKRWYRRYARSFISEDSSAGQALRLKEAHGIRVSREMRDLAAALKLNPAVKDIAVLAGLLHDIGRFEQYTRYGTFVDAKSVNHGDLGVRVLDQDFGGPQQVTPIGTCSSQ